jgi:DNA repair exonuclease SbcCD nuclease subunit
MKALITSDWHVGVRGDSDTYHDIFLDWLENFLIPTIQENNIDYLFILADFFNNRNAINTKTINIAIDCFESIVTEFPDLNIELLTGNHDIYYKNTRNISSLRMFENTHPNFKVVKDIKRFSIDNKDVVLCPWIINSDEAKELFSQKADYCFGHFEINGFELVSGVTEKTGLDASKFKKAFGKTFSGHFHIRQESDGITYVGNPFHMDWGDCGNEKGVYILNFRSGDLDFIPNTMSPQYKKVLLSQIKNKTVTSSDLAHNFVKLTIDEDVTEKAVLKLQEKILTKNLLSLTIDGFDDGEIETPDEMDENLSNPLEYLNVFIKESEFSDDIDKLELIKLSHEIHGEVQI